MYLHEIFVYLHVVDWSVVTARIVVRTVELLTRYHPQALVPVLVGREQLDVP